MMPLTMASSGESVRVIALDSGRQMRRRLADLGIAEGQVLTVIQSGGRGAVIVSLQGDARMAIGHGMAHKIRVVPAYGSGEHEPCHIAEEKA